MAFPLWLSVVGTLAFLALAAHAARPTGAAQVPSARQRRLELAALAGGGVLGVANLILIIAGLPIGPGIAWLSLLAGVAPTRGGFAGVAFLAAAQGFYPRPFAGSQVLVGMAVVAVLLAWWSRPAADPRALRRERATMIGAGLNAILACVPLVIAFVHSDGLPIPRDLYHGPTLSFMVPVVLNLVPGASPRTRRLGSLVAGVTNLVALAFLWITTLSSSDALGGHFIRPADRPRLVGEELARHPITGELDDVRLGHDGRGLAARLDGAWRLLDAADLGEAERAALLVPAGPTPACREGFECFPGAGASLVIRREAHGARLWRRDADGEHDEVGKLGLHADTGVHALQSDQVLYQASNASFVLLETGGERRSVEVDLFGLGRSPRVIAAAGRTVIVRDDRQLVVYRVPPID